MNQNLTLDQIDDGEKIHHVNDKWEEFNDFEVMAMFEKCYFPILVIIGLFLNVFTLVILFRRSLWLQHEAYIYLTAILVKNTVQLGALYVPWWLALLQDYNVASGSDVTCKFWTLLSRLLQASGWFHIALLCSVYAHHRLETIERRSSCANLCQKCCTLRGALLSVALLLIASVVVNFWYFVNASVQSLNDVKRCYVGDAASPEIRFIKISLNCLVNYVPVIILTPVLWLVVVFSKKRHSGFSFSRMDGGTEGSVDAEELRQVALWLAVVLFVLRTPFHLMHLLNESYLFHNYRAYFAVYALCLAYPVGVAIVCFVMLTRFHGEAKSMAIKCWFCAITRRRRIPLPVTSNIGGSSILQLDTFLDTGTEPQLQP